MKKHAHKKRSKDQKTDMVLSQSANLISESGVSDLRTRHVRKKIESSGGTDSDDTSTEKGELKTTKNSYKKNEILRRSVKRTFTKRTPWTEQQTETVSTFFQKEIPRHIVPGKFKCLECLNSDDCLAGKTWQLIKWKVSNIIKTNQKKGR